MAIEQVSNLNSDIQQLRAQTRQAEAIFKKIDKVTKLTHVIEPKQKQNLL